MTRDPDQTSMPSPDPARYDGSVPEPAYRTPHAEHRLREHPLDFDRFHNALRIMLNLEEHELELSRPDWLLYMKDPFRWFVRAPTPEAERIWALIEARQRAAVPDSPSDPGPATPGDMEEDANKSDAQRANEMARSVELAIRLRCKGNMARAALMLHSAEGRLMEMRHAAVRLAAGISQ